MNITEKTLKSLLSLEMNKAIPAINNINPKTVLPPEFEFVGLFLFSIIFDLHDFSTKNIIIKSLGINN